MASVSSTSVVMLVYTLTVCMAITVVYSTESTACNAHFVASVISCNCIVIAVLIANNGN